MPTLKPPVSFPRRLSFFPELDPLLPLRVPLAGVLVFIVVIVIRLRLRRDRLRGWRLLHRRTRIG